MRGKECSVQYNTLHIGDIAHEGRNGAIYATSISISYAMPRFALSLSLIHLLVVLEGQFEVDKVAFIRPSYEQCAKDKFSLFHR